MKVYSKYIQNVKRKDIIPVLEEYKKADKGSIFEIMEKYIFPFLVKNNIEIVIISGAQQELIELYKEELKINEIYGVQFKIENERYTNKYQNNGLDKNKKILVNKILENKGNVILFSFGDSISDIPLLKVARKSFINNTKERFMKASNALYYDFSKIENGKRIIVKMQEVLKEINKKD